jgi:hypothetical protein
VPRIADPDFADWFDVAGVATVPVMLDGKPKLLAKALADPALVEMEPGLGFASRIDEPAREPALAEGHC